MIIIHLISSLERGGAENHLADLCSGLVNDKKIIVFCASKNSYWSNKLRKKKIVVIHSKFINPKNFFEKLIKFILDVIHLKQLLKKYKPNILHAHLPYMELIAYISLLFNNKILFIITKHLDNIFFKQSYGQKKSFFGSIIIKVIHIKAKYIIAISKSVKRFLLKNNLVNNPKKIIVIPYGINFNIPHNIKKRDIYLFKKKYGIIKNVYTIGTISRLVPQKSLETLIEAFFFIKKKFKLKMKLIIVGKGSERHKLQQLSNIRGLKKDIIWINYLTSTNQFYKSIDVFCISSLYEGLGLVLLEAMHNKTLIVASKIKVFREIINDKKEGLLFQKRNAKDLAQKIIISMNKKLKRNIIDNAYAKLKKKFDLEKTINKTNLLYKKSIYNKYN